MLLTPYWSLSVIERPTDHEIADYLGIEPDEVESLMQQEGLDESQMTIAAVIAKKSSHSLTHVLQDHRKYTNWDQLSRSYQLEPDEIWTELKKYFPQVIWYPRAFLQQPKLLARVLSIYLNEDDQKLLRMIKKESFSLLTAAILAKISEKKVEEILLMKRNMSWEELQQSLHVKPARVLNEQKRLKNILYQELER